jgi:beta-phosphoglucomutase family hydrolase
LSKEIQAVIFDMDGVLVDSGAFHRRAWQALFQEMGSPITDPEFWRITIGRPIEEALPLLANRTLTHREIARYSRRRNDLFREFSREGVAQVPGARAFVRSLEAAGVPSALATSATRRVARLILERLDLDGSFRAVVTADEVRNGKPDPEVYLTASQRLEVNPEHCLVFEDSVAGISAALSAGMSCVGVTTSHTVDELKLAGAARAIHDFEGVTWSDINS